MVEVREYVDGRGISPFGRWFDDLDAIAAVRVRTAIARMEAGNLSNVRSVGAGLLEYRINFGPGYRVYFGRDGDRLIILLGGGTKRRQRIDIEDARRLWEEYRRRKRQEA
ncbi:MAG: type II toxin-antitoxin system RelE/ParE family toxin [Chloroflexota bacterium]|nr:type II toxin-antitoxin system RelE/ParE family toxin [Chloroflexota bacterium]MDE2885568.1 type II toxin-antitoxin system RelE/ParE family toxin [Chloroflexota bacterium]